MAEFGFPQLSSWRLTDAYFISQSFFISLSVFMFIFPLFWCSLNELLVSLLFILVYCFVSITFCSKKVSLCLQSAIFKAIFVAKRSHSWFRLEVFVSVLHHLNKFSLCNHIIRVLSQEREPEKVHPTSTFPGTYSFCFSSCFWSL